MKLTTTDIKKIVRRIVKPLNIDTYYSEDLPKGEITQERCVIATSSDKYGKVWADCIVTISLCVPDITTNVANLSRLSQLEKAAVEMLHSGIVGEYNDESYYIELTSNSIENDTQFKCHYVGIKLMFETLNIIK